MRWSTAIFVFYSFCVLSFCVLSFTPFALVCYIDWLWDELFYLCHHTIYTFCVISMFALISSSICRAISMDIPDLLSLHIPIVHCFQQILGATSRISTELLYVGSNWASCLYSSMWRGPQEYITHELVPTSPAVSHVPGLCNFDSFRDSWLVAVWLLLCGVLSPGLVQYRSQHFCVIAVKLFLHPFSQHPYSSINTIAARKKLHFILSVRSDFHVTESLSLAVHAFATRVLMSVSVDETLLPM